MSYLEYSTLTKLDLLPDELLLHICEFTKSKFAFKSRWARYYKQNLIENINLYQHNNETHPINMIAFLNQEYRYDMLFNSINLRLLMIRDMIDNHLLKSIDTELSIKLVYKFAKHSAAMYNSISLH